MFLRVFFLFFRGVESLRMGMVADRYSTAKVKLKKELNKKILNFFISLPQQDNTMKPSQFLIEKITAEMAVEIRRSPVAPHRHDYEELIILRQGEVDHFIDFRKEHVVAPVVIYIAGGKIHRIYPDENLRGWVIRYQTDFIPDNRFHFYSSFLDTINYTLSADVCLDRVDSLCELMFGEYTTQPENNPTIRHLLKAVLSKLEGERDRLFKIDPGNGNIQLIAFHNFLKILEDNYKRPEDVQFYADKMNTSVRNLNLITNAIFGKSVSEIIETRKLIEARQMLLSSPQSISEIGFELGYNEKSYFSRVFRKKTGLTPTDFRKEMQA
jgi:AraC-like DNA-binding protein